MKNSSFSIVILFILVLSPFSFVFVACDSDAPPMGDAVTKRDSLPVMVSHGVSKLISDSGRIRYKLIAEEWYVYDKTLPPRWEFPKGIFIERYDDKYKINLHITADSAWLYNQRKWKLRGNIVLDDQAAQTHLTTNELYWDMNTGELYSNVYTYLKEPNQEIEGNWFRATVINKRVTRYHVRQTKGFMPMGNIDKPVNNTGNHDSIQVDTTSLRNSSISRPKRH